MNISVIVLLVVFFLTAIRQVGRFRLKIWQIMLAGAGAVLVTGQISPLSAFRAIHFDVILFLFGMFAVGEALEQSGWLSYQTYRLFRGVKSDDYLILAVLYGAGFASAFLMNDTLAIIGTPVVLYLAERRHLSPQLMLLTLAFAITTGSTMSPIGNPQNLLIVFQADLANPFAVFLKFLFLPTIINLFVVYLLLKWFYRDHFKSRVVHHPYEPVIKDRRLARFAEISLCLILALVGIKIMMALLGMKPFIGLLPIALIGALPVFLLASRRPELVRKIDWATLVFFAAMFVLMQSVWDSGFFQALTGALGAHAASLLAIFSMGIGVSQLISNVPFTALYLPLLGHIGVGHRELMALAAASTIAGNLFILGAASNVIIIHNAEEEEGETVGFLEFARVGIPLTLIHAFIYWLFLSS